jgi:superkiller protein 3
MDLANHLIDLGETRPAMACLKRLVQIQPRNASAWQNLAVVQFMRHRYDEGIVSSREALNLCPDNLMAIHNLALAMGKMKRYREALEELHTALLKAPRDLALQRLEMRLQFLRARDAVISAIRKLCGLRPRG